MTTNWMMILVKKVFTFFSPKSSVCHARLRAGLFIQETAYGGLSYKVKKHPHTDVFFPYPGIFFLYFAAIASISIRPPFGSLATSTQERAGADSLKYSA